MNWQLQDAKNHLSKVVEKALTEGPQTVTRRGKRTAVVLSVEEYDRLTKDKDRPSFIEHLLSGPEWPDDLYKEVNRRSKTPSRPPIDF